MQAPLYSTITLIAELFVSAAIYYSLYQGYKHNRFPVKIAAAALIYEIVFNISYMAMQVPAHAKAARVESPYIIVLAIIHGILSLIMFITLVIFFILAYNHYRHGVNYFKKHKIFTIIFLCFWTFSIVSGILFYFVEYIF
jgi:hypothetical protein